MKVLNRMLNRLEEIIVMVSLAVGTTLTFIEVVLRYVFSKSLGFTHEVVIFLLIITGLIGASIGVRNKIHLGVEIVVKQFPGKIQKSIGLFCLLLNILFCLAITYLGIQHIQILRDFKQLTPELEIPVYIPRLVIPIAFGLMTLRFIQEMILYIKIPAHEFDKGGHE